MSKLRRERDISDGIAYQAVTIELADEFIRSDARAGYTSAMCKASVEMSSDIIAKRSTRGLP